MFKIVFSFLLIAQAPAFADAQSDLMTAAEKGDIDGVKKALKNRANVNTKGSGGYTALMMASYHGHTEIVKLLLARGANVDAKNENSWTPIWVASYRGHVEITKLLLAKKADPNVRQNNGGVRNTGSTALHEATKEGHKEIVILLKAAGAKDLGPTYSSSAATPKSNVVKKPVTPQLTQRQKEIIVELQKAHNNIIRIQTAMGNEPQGGSAPKFDAKVYTGQSCNAKTGVCTNNYQGGTESVSSYYSRTGGTRRTRELEYELVQYQAHYDFWLKELRKTEK